MEQQIRFCTTSDGVRIAYATVGEGPPLVMVRGWVSHLELDWENPRSRGRFEDVAARYLLVRFDKRGTGLSDRKVNDFSVDARVRDLEAVVDQLKLRRFALQGYSEGGPIAISFAVKHPRRVSRLVLIDTYARGQALGKPEVRDALIGLVRAEWGLGSETLTNMFMPDASEEEHRWFTQYQREGATREGAVAALEAVYAADVSALLPQIKTPTLIIHAKGDRAIPFEQGRELASGIPGARFVPIESDRHVPDQKSAAQIRQAVDDFLLDGPQPRGKERAPQGSVTVLFTDMESSTAITQRLGDANAQEILRTHNTIVREALKAHDGSEIKHTGDGIMASFAASSKALECAVAIQRAVAAYVEEHPEVPLGVHIGLNAGEPIAEDEDLFGTAVQLAARIAAKATGGEILASDVVRQLVAGKGFLFADRGETALRGFEDPVRLFEVRWQE